MAQRVVIFQLFAVGFRFLLTFADSSESNDTRNGTRQVQVVSHHSRAQTGVFSRGGAALSVRRDIAKSRFCRPPDESKRRVAWLAGSLLDVCRKAIVESHVAGTRQQDAVPPKRHA